MVLMAWASHIKQELIIGQPLIYKHKVHAYLVAKTFSAKTPEPVDDADAVFVMALIGFLLGCFRK